MTWSEVVGRGRAVGSALAGAPASGALKAPAVQVAACCLRSPVKPLACMRPSVGWMLTGAQKLRCPVAASQETGKPASGIPPPPCRRRPPPASGSAWVAAHGGREEHQAHECGQLHERLVWEVRKQAQQASSTAASRRVGRKDAGGGGAGGTAAAALLRAPQRKQQARSLGAHLQEPSVAPMTRRDGLESGQARELQAGVEHQAKV